MIEKSELEQLRNDRSSLEELAKHCFNEKLLKFVLNDKSDRPNGFEIEMFRLGFEIALMLIEEDKNKS